jgi:hypothetical protein
MAFSMVSALDRRISRYGLLLSGALLAASPRNDPDREKLMDYTYETWLQ